MFVRLISILIPYLTVIPGLFVFHNSWVAILVYHATMLLTIFITKRMWLFDQLGKTINTKILVFAVIVGACGGAVLYILWPRLSVPVDINIHLHRIGLTNTTWIYFIAYYVIANPILEELYWRGYLGNDAKHPILTDLLFAGYHLFVLAGYVGVIWLGAVFLVLSGAAWFWRQISRITGGLFVAILSHMAGDLTVILVIYYLTQRT
ncbi:MAG: CPBP family glutamic-type intramembrane protease [Dehalococcoidales bacterium]|nr:CPBP family glutamic-type intramembrane protease [Dehalococcoidales bacterium]